MYKRVQVVNGDNVAVCALVVNSNTVSDATLQQWAQAVAQLADKAAGVAGAHSVQNMETHAAAAAALTKLAGATGGGGNHGIKDKGRCPVCGRIYPLSSKTGKLAKHGKQYRINGRQSPKAAHCAGSGLKPTLIGRTAVR